MPTSPATRSGRASAVRSIIQPPMEEPTTICGPDVGLVEDRQRVLRPQADAAILEPAAGHAMALVVEADEGRAARPAELFQRHRLGAGHIRFEPTHEDDAGSASFRAPIGYGGAIARQGIFL